jgi:glycine cleavage system H lipoate-binding protein
MSAYTRQERFDKRYVVAAPDGLDQYIYQHYNGLCVIGLAEGHPVCHGAASDTVVDFSAGGKNVVTENHVTGKRKKGGISFTGDSVVCTVTVGEQQYPVKALVPGSLLEANERLEKEPMLLLSEPDRAGFVCIVMPPGGDKYFEKEGRQTPGLMEFDAYQTMLQSRRREDGAGT